MTSEHLEEIDAVLRLIAEIAERARRASSVLESERAEAFIVDALATADRELTATHIALMRSVYLGAKPGAEQLRLAG